ncbi:MAG: hypothetical protein HYY01_08510 [Chloroflexi bacterium]|nr:hypothetical protein [Chloroflexota bacterium]
MARKRSLFVLGILALLFAACGPAATPTPTPTVPPGATAVPTATPTPAPTATAAKSRTLRMMQPREPHTVGLQGTQHAGSPVGEPIAVNVMEPLIMSTKEGVVPRLATRWESSADLTRWRFYLRRGVKFHNGADFTARDVVEYAKFISGNRIESTVWDRVPVEEAVAVDDYTVDLIFKDSQPLHLNRAYHFLIPPLALSRDNPEMLKTSPMGTGPYRFVEWRVGLDIKLARFDDYWGPKPQIDNVRIMFRPEEAVRLAALQVGEVDWVYALGPESSSRAPKVARMASPETVWIRFDEYIQKEWTLVDPFFADKRLRLAVEYAIDRQALVALYGGFATPSLGQWASPGDFGYNPDLKSRPYDLEKARALVREAGAVGKTLTFAASTDRYIKDREVAEAVAFMIEQTGLKVKLMLMPSAELKKYKDVTGKQRQYMTDLLINPTDAVLEVEARFPWGFMEGGSHTAINDPEAPRLYKEVQAELDLAKRGEKLGKAWAYLYEQAHYIPVFKLEWMWGLAKNLEWQPGITGAPFFADMRFTD